MTAPAEQLREAVSALERAEGKVEALVDELRPTEPMVEITARERDDLLAAAGRYWFLRSRFLRAPVNVNAWGHPSYGVTVKAPHDLNPADFDRVLDALRAVEDETADELHVRATLSNGPEARA